VTLLLPRGVVGLVGQMRLHRQSAALREEEKHA
jgi:hypothetical protein